MSHDEALAEFRRLITAAPSCDQQVNFAEAALIRYFRPIYNEISRTRFRARVTRVTASASISTCTASALCSTRARCSGVFDRRTSSRRGFTTRRSSCTPAESVWPCSTSRVETLQHRPVGIDFTRRGHGGDGQGSRRGAARCCAERSPQSQGLRYQHEGACSCQAAGQPLCRARRRMQPRGIARLGDRSLGRAIREAVDSDHGPQLVHEHARSRSTTIRP